MRKGGQKEETRNFCIKILMKFDRPKIATHS
jgi:hypothetical protein